MELGETHCAQNVHAADFPELLVEFCFQNVLRHVLNETPKRKFTHYLSLPVINYIKICSICHRLAEIPMATWAAQIGRLILVDYRVDAGRGPKMMIDRN